MANLFEFLPVLLFFCTYIFFGIKNAIAVLIVASIISLFANWYRTKTISWVQLMTTVMVIFFGGISILSNDPSFLKMKVSIVNLAMAFLLVLDVLILKKVFLKKLLGSALTLPDQAWRTLTLSWACFFVLCALANEFVWRNFSESTWVCFKVFGLISLTIVFAAISIFCVQKKHPEL